MKTRGSIIVALLATAALVAAGCGGASDETGGDASAASSGGGGQELSLVAYSTPQVVYDELIPAFQKTADGEGMGFKTSFGPRATRRAPSRPARRPTW